MMSTLLTALVMPLVVSVDLQSSCWRVTSAMKLRRRDPIHPYPTSLDCRHLLHTQNRRIWFPSRLIIEIANANIARA